MEDMEQRESQYEGRANKKKRRIMREWDSKVVEED